MWSSAICTWSPGLYDLYDKAYSGETCQSGRCMGGISITACLDGTLKLFLYSMNVMECNFILLSVYLELASS